jgi:hypothetical protein
MKAFPLFELFMVVFAYYAIINYEGRGSVLIVIFCLVTVFLFAMLRTRLTKDWHTRKVFFPTNYHSIDFVRTGSNNKFLSGNVKSAFSIK